MPSTDRRDGGGADRRDGGGADRRDGGGADRTNAGEAPHPDGGPDDSERRLSTLRRDAARFLRNPTLLLQDPRVRAASLGLALGSVAVPVLVYGLGWIPRAATNNTFAFGALILGFAVTSWTAAVMLGPAVENLQTYMDLGSGWTEAGARQAFAILSALGLGMMVGSSIAGVLV